MAERSESGFPEWVGNYYPVPSIWYLWKTFRDWRTREVANRFGR